MKKFITVACVAAIALSVVGCGSESSDSSSKKADTTAATTAETADTTAATTTAAPETAESTAETTAANVGTAEEITDAIPAKDTSADKPAPLGQWVDFTLYSAVDETYHKVDVRVNGVVTETQDAQAIQDAIKLNNDVASDFGQIDTSQWKIPDDCELCLLDYEVNVPADFPKSDFGILAPETNIGVVSISGGGIPTADGSATYIGLSSSKETLAVSSDEPEYQPGNTYQFRVLYLMVKGYEDYCFSDSSYVEGTKDISEETRFSAFFAHK